MTSVRTLPQHSVVVHETPDGSSSLLDRNGRRIAIDGFDTLDDVHDALGWLRLASSAAFVRSLVPDMAS